MLPLQLNKLLDQLPRRTIFLVKLCAFIAAIHAVLLFIIFCWHAHKDRLVIPLHTSNAPICLMPFAKHVQKVASQAAPVPEKKVAASPAKKTMTTFTKKLPPKPTPAPKATKKPPVEKEPALKEKPVEKKVEKVVQEKPVEQKPIQARNPESIKQPETIKQVEPDRQNKINSEAAETELKVGRYDLDLLELAQEVKVLLELDWVRPAGLSETCVYKVVVSLAPNGDIELVQEHSSGALILDMQARNFILSYDFPRKLRGREIELVL